MTKTNKRVLLLTSPREEGWIDTSPTEVSRQLHAFVEGLNERGERSGTSYAVTTLDKLDISIIKGQVAIHDRYNECDIAEFDIVHVRNGRLYDDFAVAIGHYMVAHGKRALEVPTLEGIGDGKLSQMVLFANQGIAVPDTWATWSSRRLTELVRKAQLPFPFIVKANLGIKGHDNYLVRTQEELEQIVADNTEQQFVVQRFIPNQGDYRVLMFDGVAEPLVFKRTAAAGSHLNNTSRGGDSELVALASFDVEALSLAAQAVALSRGSVSGADVLQDSETGAWYVLEVNQNPALATGALLDVKVMKYLEMMEGLL